MRDINEKVDRKESNTITNDNYNNFNFKNCNNNNNNYDDEYNNNNNVKPAPRYMPEKVIVIKPRSFLCPILMGELESVTYFAFEDDNNSDGVMKKENFRSIITKKVGILTVFTCHT